jgi:hypothetical protein
MPVPILAHEAGVAAALAAQVAAIDSAPDAGEARQLLVRCLFSAQAEAAPGHHMSLPLPPGLSGLRHGNGAASRGGTPNPLAAAPIPHALRWWAYQHLSGGAELWRQHRGLYRALLRHGPGPADVTVRHDVHRTYPWVTFFGPRTRPGPGQSQLYRILTAYSHLDPAVGYTQGMNFLAALLLLCGVREEAAFFAFASLLLRTNMRQFYMHGLPLCLTAHEALAELLRRRKPRLAAHLDGLGVLPALYATPWLMSAFVSSPLPPSSVFAVLDCLLLEAVATPPVQTGGLEAFQGCALAPIPPLVAEARAERPSGHPHSRAAPGSRPATAGNNSERRSGGGTFSRAPPAGDARAGQGVELVPASGATPGTDNDGIARRASAARRRVSMSDTVSALPPGALQLMHPGATLDGRLAGGVLAPVAAAGEAQSSSMVSGGERLVSAASPPAGGAQVAVPTLTGEATLLHRHHPSRRGSFRMPRPARATDIPPTLLRCCLAILSVLEPRLLAADDPDGVMVLLRGDTRRRSVRSLIAPPPQQQLLPPVEPCADGEGAEGHGEHRVAEAVAAAAVDSAQPPALAAVAGTDDAAADGDAPTPNVAALDVASPTPAAAAELGSITPAAVPPAIRHAAESRSAPSSPLPSSGRGAAAQPAPVAAVERPPLRREPSAPVLESVAAQPLHATPVFALRPESSMREFGAARAGPPHRVDAGGITREDAAPRGVRGSSAAGTVGGGGGDERGSVSAVGLAWSDSASADTEASDSGRVGGSHGADAAAVGPDASVLAAVGLADQLPAAHSRGASLPVSGSRVEPPRLRAVFQASIGVPLSAHPGEASAGIGALPVPRAHRLALMSKGGPSATTVMYCDDRECEAWELPLPFLQALRSRAAHVSATELELIERRLAAARGPAVLATAATNSGGGGGGVLSGWRRRHGRGRSHSATAATLRAPLPDATGPHAQPLVAGTAAATSEAAQVPSTSVSAVAVSTAAL